jgi:hypothetical protein
MVKTGQSAALMGFSSGLLPNFMLYSSYTPDERLNYSMMITLGMFVILLNVCRKYIAEDAITKQVTLTEGEHYSKSYGKDIFVAWDNHITSKHEIDDFSGSLMQLYKEKLLDSEHAGLLKKLTDYEVALLYLRRSVGFIVFLCLQLLSYSIVIYCTIYTKRIGALVSHMGFLRVISGSIPSIVVGIINGVTPPLWSAITTFENWGRSNWLNVLLTRMYFANILNVIILGFSFILLADPYLLADQSSAYIRDQIEKPYLPTFHCRMDQVQNGLFQLIVTDWVTKSISVLVTGILPIAQAWLLKQEAKKPEFSLPPTMLSNIFSSALLLMSFPFSPLSLIISPILLSISIKWEKFVMLRFFSKPSDPIQAQKAGLIFTRLYLLTILIIGIPCTLFFLNTTTFPKNCEIQDSVSKICQTEIEDNICSVDPSSNYYFGNATICSPYPACICAGSLSCGPFINDLNALQPLKLIIIQFPPLKWIWISFLSTSYGSWSILFFLFLLSSIRKNTIKVSKAHFEDHGKLLDAQIRSLEIEKKKQAKKLARYKTAVEQNDDNE